MKGQLQASYVKDIKLYLNQLKNYSVADYAKFVMFTELFIDWQQFFQFDYVYTNVKNDSWHLHHVVDTQNQPNKFIRVVQATMILTVNEQNPNYRIYTPAEWMGVQHPFVEYHSYKGDPQKQDGRKIYEDFRIGNEKEDLCLFLPDFIGYTIYNSILNQEKKEWLMNLKRLRQNRSWTITNKFRHPNGYYHIAGFDKSKNPRDVNATIKGHWIRMRSLQNKDVGESKRILKKI